MKASTVLSVWRKILMGRIPMVSIEITRECPLTCPGCYAYGDSHLGGGVTLRQVRDLTGEDLVRGVLRIIKLHRPVQVSIVGGEPLIRKRELSQILPNLSRMGIYTLVVTSAVIPFPAEWHKLSRTRIAVSVDGLRPEHDLRRKPATYERILKNIEGRRIDISWVVTSPMMQRTGYLEEYLEFWTSRREVDRIWMSIYTPQVGEQSAEMLTPEMRRALVRKLPELKRRFPSLLMTSGIAEAFGSPPADPAQCVFSKLSVNYTADLRTVVQPCFFGGNPDCTQCGCAVTAGLHWVGRLRIAGALRFAGVINGSIAIGELANRFRRNPAPSPRWSQSSEEGIQEFRNSGIQE